MNNKIEIIQNFKNGCVGIFPTDTAFGIGCRIDDINAVNRVYQIRNRPKEKALIALFSSIEMAKEYVEITQEIKEKFIDKYWPGGVTLILKCKIEKVPQNVRANGNTLAVRLPDHKALRQLIDAIGVPIVAPSANFSGGKTPFRFVDIEENLVNKVDFVMNGVCTIKGISTIIDCTMDNYQIVRQGNVKVKI